MPKKPVKKATTVNPNVQIARSIARIGWVGLAGSVLIGVGCILNANNADIGAVVWVELLLAFVVLVLAMLMYQGTVRLLERVAKSFESSKGMSPVSDDTPDVEEALGGIIGLLRETKEKVDALPTQKSSQTPDNAPLEDIQKAILDLRNRIDASKPTNKTTDESALTDKIEDLSKEIKALAKRPSQRTAATTPVAETQELSSAKAEGLSARFDTLESLVLGLNDNIAKGNAKQNNNETVLNALQQNKEDITSRIGAISAEINVLKINLPKDAPADTSITLEKIDSRLGIIESTLSTITPSQEQANTIDLSPITERLTTLEGAVKSLPTAETLGTKDPKTGAAVSLASISEHLNGLDESVHATVDVIETLNNTSDLAKLEDLIVDTRNAVASIPAPAPSAKAPDLSPLENRLEKIEEAIQNAKPVSLSDDHQRKAYLVAMAQAFMLGEFSEEQWELFYQLVSQCITNTTKTSETELDTIYKQFFEE